jgi:DivIVA domain-containing protein
VLFLEVVIIAIVLFAIGAVVAIRRRELADPVRDTTDTRVPPEQLRMAPSDVDALRFGVALRGYRMDQVDDALDRLRDELRARDERIAELQQSAGRSQPRAWSPPVEEPATAAGPFRPVVTGELFTPAGTPGTMTEPPSARAPAETSVEAPTVEVPQPVADADAEAEPVAEPSVQLPDAAEVEKEPAEVPHVPVDEVEEPTTEPELPEPAGEAAPEPLGSSGDRISKLRRVSPAPER